MPPTNKIFQHYNLQILKSIVGNQKFDFNPKLNSENPVYSKPIEFDLTYKLARKPINLN